MQVNYKLHLKTWLHTDPPETQRSKRLQRCDSRGSVFPDLFDIRGPGCAAGGDIEATIALTARSRKGKASLHFGWQAATMSVSGRAVQETVWKIVHSKSALQQLDALVWMHLGC